MAGKTVGTLNVMLKASTGKFDAGMKSAEKTTKKFSTTVASASKKVAAFGLAAGTAAAGALAVMVKRQMAAIDATAKLADRLGVTTEELQRLRHAADITGAGAERLDAGLETMSKRLGEATAGIGRAKPALAMLGLEANKIAAMDPASAFKEIAEKISQVESPTRRAAIAAGIFSRANMELINTLSLGKAGLAQLGDEADKLGITFDRKMAAKVEEANDAINRMGKAWSGMVIEITTKVAPVIEDLANTITELVGALNESKKALGEHNKNIPGKEGFLGTWQKHLAAQGTGMLAGAVDYGTKALYSLDTPFTDLAKGKVRSRGDTVEGFVKGLWDAHDRALTAMGEAKHGLAKATSGKERRAAAEAAKTPEQRRKEMDAFVGSYLKRLFQGGAAVGGAGKNIFDAFTGTGKRSAPFLKYMFDTKAAPKISMEERKPDTSFAFAQTAVKGSLEAYRTIARSMGGGGADPMLKEQRKGVQLLGRIEKNTRNDGGDGVQAVAIPA